MSTNPLFFSLVKRAHKLFDFVLASLPFELILYMVVKLLLLYNIFCFSAKYVYDIYCFVLGTISGS